MPSSDDYRRYAAECVALAQKASTPEDRLRLMAMAQAWRELADKLDAKL